jgi:hypothetical protein
VKSSIGAIAWKPSRQATVSRCLVQLSLNILLLARLPKKCSILYLVQVIKQFGIEAPCVSVGIGFMAVRHLILDPVSSVRTKHVDTIYHHVRERERSGDIKFFSVSTRENINIADIFTKPLPRELFEKHRNGLGVMLEGVREC